MSSNPELKAAIDAALNSAKTVQVNVATNVLEKEEDNLAEVQDILKRIKAGLDDIRYLKDYEPRMFLSDDSYFKDLEDLVLRSTLEHQADNAFRGGKQILQLFKKRIALEELLAQSRSVVLKYGDKGLPELRRYLSEIEAQLKQNEVNRVEIESRDPESFIMSGLIKLRALKSEMQTGKIVETPSIHAHALDIEEAMLAGKPVLLKGPPGTGKTEILKHVTNKLSQDKNKRNIKLPEENTKENENKVESGPAYYIVSCNRDMQYSELVGVRNIKANENGMETVYDYGPMYRAMSEGVPLIIDEVNALPPETLLKLNENLTRKPGDIIKTQENGGKDITIKEGFCFVFTGNVGTNYAGRFKLESSFIDRMGKVIDYDYVPNASGVTDKISDVASESELWHIMLASFMNDKAIIHMPSGDMGALWNMSKAVRKSQDIFSGTDTNFTMSGPGGGLDPVSPTERIKDTPISMRSVLNILEAYKLDMSLPLEYHIMNKFILERTDKNSRGVYMIIFKSFGFFADKNIYKETKTATGEIIINIDKEKAKRGDLSMKTYSSRETATLAYGDAPSIAKAQYTDIQKRYEAKLTPEESSGLEKERQDLEKEKKKLEAERLKKEEINKAADELLKNLDRFGKTGDPLNPAISLNPHSILTTREATDTKAGIYHWSNFTTQILPLIKNQDAQIQIPTFTTYDLSVLTTGQQILDREKQSGRKEEDILWTPAELSYFISNQSEIKDKDTNTPSVANSLKIDSNANIFLMKNNEGNIVAVSARWLSGDRKWLLYAFDLSVQWLASVQVLSRN